MNPPRKHSLTVDEHLHFQRSLSTDARGVDAIDRAVDDEEAANFDPCILDRPPGRRKESEISRLDAIFDELERRDG